MEIFDTYPHPLYIILLDAASMSSENITLIELSGVEKLLTVLYLR